MRLWLASAAFVAVISLGVGSSAQQASKIRPTADAGAKAANPDDFVGAEVCATCHESEAKGFASNPHTKLALENGKNGATCESCHGAGKAHVESGGDVTKSFSPAKASSKERGAAWLSCHPGPPPNLLRPPAPKAKVGFAQRHSVH